MIEIICDQYGFHPLREEDFVLREDFQYEEGLTRIREAALTGVDCCIVVKNPALFHWFDAPSKQFGCRMTRIDPITELERALRSPVLPEILRQHPEWIVELHLLKRVAEETALPGESVDAWLKRILLGRVWQVKSPGSVEDIVEVFSWLVTRNEQVLHPLEMILLKDQIQFWIINYSEKSELFQWLAKDPFFRAKYVVWEQMLIRYPEARIAEWLQHEDIWYNLSLLPDRKQHIPDLDLQIQLPEAIAIFVRSYLEEQWEDSPKKAIHLITGRIEIEKSVLLERLRHRLNIGIPIERDVFELIVRLHNFPEIIELAYQLLPAKEPSHLSSNSSVWAVQEWLRDEYLPFYDSCALFNRLELTEPYVEQFEIWLKDSYAGLLINGSGMAYRQLSRLKERLSDGPLLLVVFDGLDYLSAQNELLPALKEYGLYSEEELSPYLSFLPTETFIAKPTLVCGWMNSQIPREVPDASFYRELLQRSFDLAEDEIRSATDKDLSLHELVQKPAKVYLFLDNQLDREYLHSGLSQHVRQKKYTAHVKRQAVILAETVQLVKELYNTTLLISVCSDHGHTVIPKNASIINVPDAKTSKIRSMYMDGVELPENFDETKIWRLKPGLFGLNEEMAIPLGYGCFAKRSLGATHGGCTPQELSVPWFVISSQKPGPLKPLVFSIKGEIFRRREENQVTATISNPNSHTVSVIECAMEGMDISMQLPLLIVKHSLCSIPASFNATAVKDNVIQIKGFYSFKSQFGDMKNTISLKVPTTGAMDTEFDDDFEF